MSVGNRTDEVEHGTTERVTPCAALGRVRRRLDMNAEVRTLTDRGAQQRCVVERKERLGKNHTSPAHRASTLPPVLCDHGRCASLNTEGCRLASRLNGGTTYTHTYTTARRVCSVSRVQPSSATRTRGETMSPTKTVTWFQPTYNWLFQNSTALKYVPRITFRDIARRYQKTEI